MTNPTGSFIWYELITPDPDGAKAFYDAVVGWEIEARPAGEMDYRMISRSDGGNAGGILRLTTEMAAGGGRPLWLGYVAVGDVDATIASIHLAGGKTMMPATDMPEVGRIAMIADPDGAPLYIMTPTPPVERPDNVSDVFSVDQAQHVRWNELASANPNNAVAFYRQHFGWEQEGDMDMGPMGKYHFLQHGGIGIGAIMTKPEEMPTSLWTYYFGVDDIDRAVGAIGEGGGTVVNGPHEIPGGEFSLHAIDPQRASFGLVGPRQR